AQHGRLIACPDKRLARAGVATSPRYHAVMWRSCSQTSTGSDALEAHAQRAGAALACAYANSAEFDAALIAERRAAGVYGPRRRRWRVWATAVSLAGLAAVIFLIV